MTKKTKLKIGVIFGGRSGEHEVSLVSARSVIKALNKKKYQVIPIYVTSQGQWHSSSEAVSKIKANKADQIPAIQFSPDPAQQFIDVAFPLIHGTFGEDGTLQGLLELANLPYVGAEVMASAVAMDKVVTKQLLAHSGIPVVKSVNFLRKDWKINSKKVLKQINKELDFPIFIKPANSGSSVGINKSKNLKQLRMHINEACYYDRKILAEQGIEHYHELEVAVLGNDRPKASVVGEILSCREFYDYRAKYLAGTTKTIAPAKIPNELAQKTRQLAIKAFKVLNGAGMARVDFLYDKDVKKLYISEINTIPGFTSISMYPKLWAKSGLAYPKLLDKLIQLALERHRDKNLSHTSFQQKTNWHQK